MIDNWTCIASLYFSTSTRPQKQNCVQKRFMHQSASINLINALTYKYTLGVIYLISLSSLHLINILLVVESWNRQHHGQNIHPTEKLISVNLFKILCVVTWAWLFLTSMVMEAVRGQKRYRECTLWLNDQLIPQCQFCLLIEIKAI